jgi:hypothetical protein
MGVDKMNYTYHTAQGKAILNKGDDFKLVKIGLFKTEAEAKKACLAHYAKACNTLENFGRQLPSISFL